MTPGASDRRGASDQRAIRRSNLSAVVRLLAAGDARSRATIAVETGFNKSTVSSLVGELIDVGLLSETGEDEHPGRVGRPARTVRLAGDAVVAVGLEVNVDHLAVCTVDLSGAVRHRERIDADNTARLPRDVLDALAGLADDAIHAAEAEGAMVVGAAIGLPGLVDQRRRELIVAPNLGWHEVPVADELSARLGRPELLIAVDNEANLAALAEHWDGAARDLDDVIFVSGDVGIGAGVLIGGELHRGSHGFAGELGHVAIDPAGERCACGSRGCLETIAGQAALRRNAGLPATGPHSGVAELVGRARAADARTLAALAQAGHAVGVALSAVVNLLDLDAVILGGAFAPLTPWLERPVAAQLGRRVLASAWTGCEIRAAELADGATTRGAAATVLRAVIADPTLVAGIAPRAGQVRYSVSVGR